MQSPAQQYLGSIQCNSVNSPRYRMTQCSHLNAVTPMHSNNHHPPFPCRHDLESFRVYQGDLPTKADILLDIVRWLPSTALWQKPLPLADFIYIDAQLLLQQYATHRMLPFLKRPYVVLLFSFSPFTAEGGCKAPSSCGLWLAIDFSSDSHSRLTVLVSRACLKVMVGLH